MEETLRATNVERDENLSGLGSAGRKPQNSARAIAGIQDQKGLIKLHSQETTRRFTVEKSGREKFPKTPAEVGEDGSGGGGVGTGKG